MSRRIDMTAETERAGRLRSLGRFIAAPVRDYFGVLEAIRGDGHTSRHFCEGGNPAAFGKTSVSPRHSSLPPNASIEGADHRLSLLKAGVAFVASWFLYVPAHELL